MSGKANILGPKETASSVITQLANRMALDLRSLALLRVLVGVLILFDLWNRSTDLTAFYSDAGVLPRGPYLEKFLQSQLFFSLHLINGSTQFQAVLFLFAAMAALAMIVGCRTRMATVISWVMLVSVQVRNPMILHGGDVVLRVLLFWTMFLPLGERWSVDSWTAAKSTTRERIFSAAAFGYLLQLCMVYWFSYLLKFGADWQNGTAVYYALSFDQLTSSFGRGLLKYPDFLVFLTRATLILEWFGPWLVWIPIFTGFFRSITILAFLGFHIGLALTMELSLFPYVCMAAWLALLPSGFWDRILPWLRKLVPQPVAGLHAKVRELVVNGRTPSRLQEPSSEPSEDWKAARNLARISGTAFLLFLSLYVFMWNLRSVDFARWEKIFPRSWNTLGMLLRLDQAWNLFSANPSKEDGWYVIPGKLRDGTEVDLFKNGAAVTWDKPESIPALYKNQRWTKFLMNLADKKNSDYRLYYARYLTRQWNSSNRFGAQVESFQICFMLELTPPPGVAPKPTKLLLWNHQCFDTPKAQPKSPPAPIATVTATNAPIVIRTNPFPTRPVPYPFPFRGTNRPPVGKMNGTQPTNSVKNLN